MAKIRFILMRCLGSALALGALSACGQRGPLYLPTEAAAADRATLPQTILRIPGGPSRASPSPTPGAADGAQAAADRPAPDAPANAPAAP